MANIQVDGGHGKKSVDAEIPLIPFIDLLLCCVMFLLVTAVWNQLAQLDVNQRTPGPSTSMDPPPPTIQRYLQVTAAGYTLASTAGDHIEIPRVNELYDRDALRTHLSDLRRSAPDRNDLIVAPEDGVPYQEVIVAMDAAVGEGFDDVSMSDGAAL